MSKSLPAKISSKTLLSPYNVVDSLIREGKAFSEEMLDVIKQNSSMARYLLGKINTADNPVVAKIIEQTISDRLKMEFIEMAVYNYPRQFVLVPGHLQSESMVSTAVGSVAYVSNEKVDDYARQLFESITGHLRTEDHIKDIVTFSPAIYEHLPENLKTPNMVDKLWAAVRNRNNPYDFDSSLSHLKMIEEKDFTEYMALHFVITDPSLFHHVPNGSRTDKVCRRFFSHTDKDFTAVVPYVPRDVLKDMVGQRLTSMKITSDPVELLNSYAKRKNGPTRDLIEVALIAIGIEALAPLAMTPRHAVTLQQIFGVEHLPENLKHLKTAKRHAVSSDLGL